MTFAVDAETPVPAAGRRYADQAMAMPHQAYDIHGGLPRLFGRLQFQAGGLGGLIRDGLEVVARAFDWRAADSNRARTASWRLAPELVSVPRSRCLTRARLARWGLRDQTAELLVSELVTNAVCHGRGPVLLTLFAEDGLLRCEVGDAEDTLPEMRSAYKDDESGRGLFLLDMLSCCWGTDRTSAGKVVWFELPVKGPA
ncbi:ATP-binding protein [Nonomuraea recticatena]|uniref:ATP-binding protein n=1 Tax=Nonomuraea recticatena TaxID=46178 RepID=UPI00360ED034